MNSSTVLIPIIIFALFAIILKVTGKKKAGAICAGLMFASLGIHQFIQEDSVLAITALIFGSFLAVEPYLNQLRK
jgi:hypothetical protein